MILHIISAIFLRSCRFACGQFQWETCHIQNQTLAFINNHISGECESLSQNLQISQRHNIFFQNIPFKYTFGHILKTDSKYTLYPTDIGRKVCNTYIILYFFFVYCTCYNVYGSILVDPSNFHFGLVIT